MSLALASIRRPSAWNATVGMRPSLGLVSRTGVYGGWPARVIGPTEPFSPFDGLADALGRELDALAEIETRDAGKRSRGIPRSTSSTTRC